MAADSVLQYDDIVDFRYNPFTGEFDPLTIGRNGNPVERRTVPNSAPYHIKLFEVPEQTTPSSMRVVPSAGGSELDEVSITVTPGSGQYRATYYNELAPGILGFNSAQAGVQMDISYNGLGHGYQKISLDTRVPSTGDTTIAGNKTISGSLIGGGAGGDLDITGNVDASARVSAGTEMFCDSAAQSNSKDTGALIARNGGLGVEKKIHSGDDITSDADMNCQNLNAAVATKRGVAGTLMREKIVEIGDWDMDIASGINVTHNLGADWRKIKAVNVIIRRDDDDRYYKLEKHSDAALEMGGGVDFISSTIIALIRRTGGFFDNNLFDDFGGVQGNRGWVYFLYEV
jgi:hypothetical protein